MYAVRIRQLLYNPTDFRNQVDLLLHTRIMT